MKKSKKILCIVIAAVLVIACVIGIIVIRNYKNVHKYDENNIGELYCSPIDEDHIAKKDNNIMYADNEILLVSKENVKKAIIETLAKIYNGEIVGYIEQTGDYQIRFEKVKNEEELNEIISKLKDNKNVESVTLNYISEVSEDSVDYDVNHGTKWNVDKQDDKSWGVRAINMWYAWSFMNENKSKINPIKVGLIDSGFDTSHEDLGFAENGVFYDNGANGVNQDDKNHGTHVAGIMAAKGNKSTGICGVYPYGDGKLYGASWKGSSKKPENEKISYMYEKVCFAELILRNVKVINCSYECNLSTYYNNDKDKKGIKINADSLADYLKRLLDKGYDFVIVAAAGNDSNDYVINLSYDKKNDKYNFKDSFFYHTIDYDKNGKPTCVSFNKKSNKYYYEYEENNKKTKYEVKGITSNDQIFYPPDDVEGGHLNSEYVSRLTAIDLKEVKDRIIVVGAVDKENNLTYYSNSGERTDIYAPGGIDELQIYSSMPNNKYGNLMGTSMAAPHVAGVCADVWSLNNNLTGVEVKDIVCKSVLDNSHEGYPVVDCFKAVVKAESSKTDNKPKNPDKGGFMVWVIDDKEFLKDVTAKAFKSGEKDPVETIITDDSGHVEFFLDEGDYEITFEKIGYKTEKLSVTVKNGEVIYPKEWIKMSKDSENTLSDKNYTWSVEPTIEAEDIIVLDESYISPKFISNGENDVKDNDGNIIKLASRTDFAVIKNNGKYSFIDYLGNVLSDYYPQFHADASGKVCLWNDAYGKDAGGLIKRVILSSDMKLIEEGTDLDRFWIKGGGFYYYRKNNQVLESYIDVEYWRIGESNNYYKKSLKDVEFQGYHTIREINFSDDIVENDNREIIATANGLGKYAIINNGKLITDFIFDDAVSNLFDDSDIIACKKDGYWNYYYTNGNLLTNDKFDDVYNIFDTGTTFKYDNGRSPDPIKESHIYLPTEGYIAVNKNSGYGYYNTKGEEVITCGEFEQARPVYGGKAWVKKNGKWGVIKLSAQR